MNALRLMSVLTLLLILLPWRAQAAEADDFVAASRSQQAQLLTKWAAAPQADRLPLLRALTTESLVMDDGKHAFRTRQGGLQPLGAVAAPQGETRPVRLTNRLRNLAAGALASHLILSDNVTERASAARTLQREATPAMAALLQQRLKAESDDNVRGLLEVALARLQLTQPEAAARLAAVTLLGHSADPETQALLLPFTDAQHEPDAAVREAASDSLQKIKHRLLIGDLLGQAFMGLSLGSVLLLAALGLAITYGLLGVINMAHGEMLMIGAYSCWLVQQALAQLAPQWLAFYPLVALPVAFLVTAGIGMALERTIIRHLYGRPLETLLATWGISLMLIQLVRMLFGAQNVEVANPAWLSGGVQVLPNLILPWNRLAVLAFVLLVLCFTWLILNRTRLGDERPRRYAEPGDGRLLRRAYRAGGYAGLWPRLRYCRAGRRGAVAARQRRARAGSGLYHRLIPGGGPGRRRPAGRQRGGGLWAGHFQQNSRTADGRGVGQDPDSGDDYSVYSETPAGSVRAEREGD